MAKPRIIIADTDISYIIPLQLKFVEDFFEKVDLEIISDTEYFDTLFSTPQRADILIISDELYSQSMQRHNISHIFVMNEQYEEEQTADLNVNHIFKYTSIKEIFNEITGKSADVLKIENNGKQETQIILFYSASGGAGKTTVAMGVSASLTKNYKRVLYINAARLQVFQHMLENHSAITAADVYAKLATATDNIYEDIKHVIRKELFNYLPPFKAALMSLGLSYSVFEKIVSSAKKSGDYDFIVVDADVTFDEEKAFLFNIADKVIVVTKQNLASVLATNILVANINGANTEKYTFICNDFDKEKDNALISPNVSVKFSVGEYIEHFKHYDNMKPDDLSKESSIQKAAFLIIQEGRTMNKETAIIVFNIIKRNFTVDLEAPLDISANDLVNALNTAYELGIDTSDIKNCYLKAENPITLLKGNKTLAEFGLRNGSVINFTEQEGKLNEQIQNYHFK